MRLLLVALAPTCVCAGPSLKEIVTRLEEDKAACSACNLVAKALDDAPLGSSLVKGWKAWSEAERGAQLAKVLRRSCGRLTDPGIEVAVTGKAGGRTFFDRIEIRKGGGGINIDGDLTYKKHPGETLQALCKALAREDAGRIAARMDTWATGKKGRRLVDFRFMGADAGLCVGEGGLGVCTALPKGRGEVEWTNKKVAEDDEDEDAPTRYSDRSEL